MHGGKHMPISYNNLWKLLIDKNMNKSELRSITGISSSTMAKITNQEAVALPVLEKICAELECNIEDVMQFTYLEETKKKMHSKK